MRILPRLLPAAVLVQLALRVGPASGVANSLSDCLAFAKLFPSNTCTASNTPAASVAAIEGTAVTCVTPNTATYVQLCSNYAGVATDVSGGLQCSWTARLCVTCSGAAATAYAPSRIRVQTNGLPVYCQLDSARGALPLLYDFDVAFAPDVRAAPLTYNFSSSAALSAVVCTQAQYAASPAPSALVDHGSTATFATALGIALGGTIIGSPNSGTKWQSLNVDPFSPPAACEAANPVTCGPEKVDSALTHPNPDGVLHTHIMNKYMLGTLTGQQGLTACTTQCADLQAFALGQMAAYKTLTPIGLARDGHIVYGPYGSDGVQITTALDACNGGYVTAGGDYGYVATTTYPYFAGCLGPANYPSAGTAPSCSANPRTVYVPGPFAPSSGGGGADAPSSAAALTPAQIGGIAAASVCAAGALALALVCLLRQRRSAAGDAGDCLIIRGAPAAKYGAVAAADADKGGEGGAGAPKFATSGGGV